MSESIIKMINSRRSVRSFDGEALRKEHREALERYMKSLKNPFAIPVEFRLLDVEEYGLSSPVIVGANTYIGAKVSRMLDCEMAFGYSFEKICLYACSLGLGTVMLASTLSRSAFEKAMNVGENEVLPLASPVGYPAKKMSVRETVMRKGIKADTRKPFEMLFFDGDFSKPLTKERAGCYAEALEAVRWAPSAVNAQPWRVVIDGEQVHFFKYRSMKDNPIGDVQKVDIGIALAHFDEVLSEQGLNGNFVKLETKIVLPENMEYMITFQRS